MRNILVVEDDPITFKRIQAALATEFKLFNCETIAEAKKLLSTSNNTFSLCIFDRGLSDGDGLILCSYLKETESLAHIPIIFLTAAALEQDKVVAFYAGADDYITKPFGHLELKARVHARLKNASSNLSLGNLRVEIDAHRVYNISVENEGEIELTRTEFKLLVTLLKSAGDVLSRESILNKVWSDNMNIDDRVIDSHVCNLRKKIANANLSIFSLRGDGYKIGLSSSSKNKSKIA